MSLRSRHEHCSSPCGRRWSALWARQSPSVKLRACGFGFAHLEHLAHVSAQSRQTLKSDTGIEVNGDSKKQNGGLVLQSIGDRVVRFPTPGFTRGHPGSINAKPKGALSGRRVEVGWSLGAICPSSLQSPSCAARARRVAKLRVVESALNLSSDWGILKRSPRPGRQDCG